ncbi:helix-turn-helix transcriptional regulator [Nocardioides dilutus]
MPSGTPPPAPATSLIGRDAEVERVRDLLARPGLVTLTGPPGVGKSRLALAVCAEGAPSPAVWVDLAPFQDPVQARAEVTRTIGAAARSGRELLVVLDNCEHLLDLDPERDLAAVVGDLVSSNPGLRVLATSRERLRLSAEREYPVPPLSLPSDADVDDLESLRRNPAVAMLLDRSPAGVRLTPGTARALADVCLRLDGLPLALELAAARLRVFTPSELAFRLERRMALLTSSPRDTPVRHRDLRTAIAWSHDLLPEHERAVFRRLSVFPGEWTLESADAVCGEPDLLGMVESLLDKNLVRRSGADLGGEARFTMLMSLREYAGERLDEEGDGPEVRDRHAAWFAGRAREWEATLGTQSETATWPPLGASGADLRAALEHSLVTEADLDVVVWLAVALCWRSYHRGVLVDAPVPLAALTRLVDRPELGGETRVAGRLAAGVVAYGLGEHGAAERDLARVARDAGPDDRRGVLACAFLGHVARERGDLAGAAMRYTAARAAYEQWGNIRGQAWAGHDLALLALERDATEEAESLLRESLRLFQSLDYEWAIAVCSSLLACVLVRTGESHDVDEAAGLLRRALTLHDRVGDRRGIAQSLEVLAEVALARGAAATAARLAGAAALRRDLVDAAPTEVESRRLARLDARLQRHLGRVAADHERHAGRTMPADAVLELAGRVTTVAPPEASSAVELTSRQLEVAALVAAGRTNRQIGKELGISEKTIEIHVHNIMSRLEVPSRAAVAAWAAARGLQPSTYPSTP